MSLETEKKVTNESPAVVFLDIDGVVNTPWWCFSQTDGWRSRYNFPEDGQVNNTQAVQWVSEFCLKFRYDLVISSTWRKGITLTTLQNILDQSGLRPGIKVIGKTPCLDWINSASKEPAQRGDEISSWLAAHPEIDRYLIFDDDCDMGKHMDHLVKTRCDAGFLEEDYVAAMNKHLFLYPGSE